MNFELQDTLQFLTKHGSQAYGLSNELSDLDVKGICVPPAKTELDLFHKFEQAENHPYIEGLVDKFKNPLNPKIESTVYSLKKFFILCAGCNPNILELLHVDQEDVIVFNTLLNDLFKNKELFLSSKAKFTFAGYAYAQLERINRHRKWLSSPIKEKPERKAFGLPDVPSKLQAEVERYIKKQVEEWNMHQLSLDELQRQELKEVVWDLVYNLVNRKITWDTWPEEHALAAFHKLQEELGLKDEVTELMIREHKYNEAMNHFNSYIKWKEGRNKDRKVLEEKFGYDTKHASHLVRLLRMGIEILRDGKVIVKRPDREELLAIKNGAWSYEKLMEYNQNAQIELDQAYKTTALPRSPDFVKINNLYLRITEACYAFYKHNATR